MIKTLLVPLLLASGLAIYSPTAVRASVTCQDNSQATNQQSCPNENFQPNRPPGNLADPSKSFDLIGALVSNMLSLVIFAGVLVALAFIAQGAIQWISASGPEGTAKARKTITYAIIGLIMLGSVYVFILLFNSLGRSG